MKVFLSWSGDCSHKVALALREWLPSVIQTIEPYVSSEDIDKGARWSIDIANELENSTYGILCVTKENINAPWLMFEAGALSKTMDKTRVSPFLFDVKRSEVDGPILQFQSTIWDKGDIQKLVTGLSKASGNEVLTDERLSKTFDVWYPTLEIEFNKIKELNLNSNYKEVNSGENEVENAKILEEILDLSRVNQKILRDPDHVTKSSFEEIKSSLSDLKERVNRPMGWGSRKRRFDSMFIEDLIHGAPFNKGYSAFLMAISVFRDDTPWVYEAGMDAVKELKSSNPQLSKDDVLMQFEQVIDFSFNHPAVRELSIAKDLRMYARNLPYLLRECYAQNS